MRIVKYMGQPTALGRHGEITAGAILHLRECEYAPVSRDPLFRLEKDVTPEPKFPKAPVLPWATPEFNLRAIRWSGNLERQLARMTKVKLCKIAAAMNRLGMPVPMDPKDDRLDIVDAIHYYSKFYRWDKLTSSELQECGEFTRREHRMIAAVQ